jgi:hypothetical protein
VGGGIFWKRTFLWDNILEGDSNGHVCGQYTTHEWGSGGKILKFESRKCHFLPFWASKFAPKFILTILVFEINNGKNAQKLNKINHIYHYLLEEDSNGHVCGGVLRQKIIEIWSTEMPFPAFWASKFALKFMLTIVVFAEINEGKNAQKVKKNIKIFEIWNPEMLFPAFWASKK